MDGRIFHVQQQIAQDLSRHWTDEEMASMAQLSPQHIIRLFKQYIGVTPCAFVSGLRLERARELLKSSFLQIKQIRVEVGIGDESHFTRDFKEKFGLTPTEYRKQHWELEQSFPPDGQE